GRVERALAEAVAVADQLLGDLRPVDRVLGGVVEDVQADEAVEEMAGDGVVGHDVGLRCRISPSVTRGRPRRKRWPGGQERVTNDACPLVSPPARLLSLPSGRAPILHGNGSWYLVRVIPRTRLGAF